MRILVLGSGLMGPAAAFNAAADPRVMQVTMCDASQAQLDAARAKLCTLPGADKLSTVALDLNDERSAAQLFSNFDAAVAALPKAAIPLGIRAAAAAQIPLVDLSWPAEDDLADLRQMVDEAGTLVILGCGLEPGLTEIMARYLAEKLDRVDELYIKVGGIPEVPKPPLGYKIVFGGRHLPLRPADVCVVTDGQLHAVPRYSEVEKVVFPDVGECEAWHEGFMPWLLDLEALRGLRRGTQKTIRWPGYAAKALFLRELGLLSPEPIEVDGQHIAPKRFLDALLYPRVRLEEGERDITCFRVEAMGQLDGCPRCLRVEMVDRYDGVLGFTSMARTTAFTGAIIARLIAGGELLATGLRTPEQLITGRLFDRLVSELAEAGVRFSLSTETVEPLQ